MDETPEQRTKRLQQMKDWRERNRESVLAQKKAQYDAMTPEERETFLAKNRNRYMEQRPLCELCEEKPRLKKRTRCGSCDPMCRQCDGTRYGDNLLCAACMSKKRRERYATDDDNRRKRLSDNTASNVLLRIEVFAAYGNICACCGESEPLFLTLDHINNDGAQERKDTKLYGGIQFYRYVRDLGCPVDRYRLLCWNCNCGRERNGGICPHQSASPGVEPG